MPLHTSSSRTLALAYASWVAICVIWGTTYLAIRITLETLPPGLSGGLRWTLAGCLMTLLLWMRGHRLPPRKHWPGLALIGFLFIPAGNGLVVWAEQWVPSGLTAVLLATTPFWMVGLELLAPRGDRPGVRTWGGLLVGFCGILLLVWPDLRAGGTSSAGFALGVVALQVACLTWAIGSSYQHRKVIAAAPLSAAAVQMLSGGLMLLVIGSAAGEWPRVAFSLRTGLAFGYLVLIGSVVGYSSYLYALEHLPISTVSLYSYINPIIAVVLGWLILDEPFGVRTAVASAVVLIGVALVRMDHGGEGARQAVEPRNPLLRPVTPE